MCKRIDSLVTTVRQHATAIKVSGSVAIMTMVPAMTSLASESGSASGALDGEVWTAITDAFGKLAVVAAQVVAISVVSATGIVVMTTGAKYALKQIKGLLSKAA